MNKYFWSSSFQFFFSACVIFSRFKKDLFCRSISPFACGHKGVIRRCVIPFCSQYWIVKHCVHRSASHMWLH
jgi:hypothetical protein